MKEFFERRYRESLLAPPCSTEEESIDDAICMQPRKRPAKDALEDAERIKKQNEEHYLVPSFACVCLCQEAEADALGRTFYFLKTSTLVS